MPLAYLLAVLEKAAKPMLVRLCLTTAGGVRMIPDSGSRLDTSGRQPLESTPIQTFFRHSLASPAPRLCASAREPIPRRPYERDHQPNAATRSV